MAIEIALHGSGGVVQDGRVELDLGPASPLGERLLQGLMLSAAFWAVAAFVLIVGSTPWRSALLCISLSALVPLSFLLALLRVQARGDKLRLVFLRGPGAGATYEVFHWNRLVLTGPFTPQRLHLGISEGAAPESAARISWMHALYFRPDPPATMVHPRLRDGIKLFESRKIEETAAQAAALCAHLGLDPSELAPDAAQAVDAMANLGPLLWRWVTRRKP